MENNLKEYRVGLIISEEVDIIVKASSPEEAEKLAKENYHEYEVETWWGNNIEVTFSDLCGWEDEGEE